MDLKETFQKVWRVGGVLLIIRALSEEEMEKWKEEMGSCTSELEGEEKVHEDHSSLKNNFVMACKHFKDQMERFKLTIGYDCLVSERRLIWTSYGRDWQNLWKKKNRIISNLAEGDV